MGANLLVRYTASARPDVSNAFVGAVNEALKVRPGAGSAVAPRPETSLHIMDTELGEHEVRKVLRQAAEKVPGDMRRQARELAGCPVVVPLPAEPTAEHFQ